MIGHRELNMQDYWQIFRRRRWFVIVPLIVVPIVALGLSFVLPKKWTSRSAILIEQQRVPSDIVQPVITEDLNARLATMQEQVLSRTRLESLIKKYSLFKADHGRESTEQLAERLLKDINLSAVRPQVSSQGSGQALPGFSVAVELDDPRMAQQVCSDITSMFIDENLRQREQAAQGTTNFLQGQLDNAKQSLDQQDATLAAFQEKYFGSLPDQAEENMKVLGTLNTQLQAASNQLDRAQQDKAYTQSEIAALTQVQKSASGGAPTPQTESELQKELKTLQTRLAAMETQYTSSYPDVVQLKQLIAGLKKRIKQNPSAKSETASAASAPVLDPAQAAQLSQLRNELHNDNVEIAAYSRQENYLQQQIKLYESRVQLSPKVEQQYKEITRNYNTALGVYNNLLKKRDESRMATDMERDQQGEQFVLIDPASLPQKPSFPDRRKFGGAGLGGGLALGVALAFLLEMKDKSIWNELDVQAVLGAYPLARIPVFSEAKKNKRSGGVLHVPEAGEAAGVSVRK